MLSKSDEKATSDAAASSVPCKALKARGSSTDGDFGAAAGADAEGFVGGAEVAARFRLAATEFEASFLPSVAFVGSYRFS